jgi:hypothetical protein
MDSSPLFRLQTANLGCCLARESQEASACPWIPGVVGREDLRLAAARQRFPKVTPSYSIYTSSSKHYILSWRRGFLASKTNLLDKHAFGKDRSGGGVKSRFGTRACNVHKAQQTQKATCAYYVGRKSISVCPFRLGELDALVSLISLHWFLLPEHNSLVNH